MKTLFTELKENVPDALATTRVELPVLIGYIRTLAAEKIRQALLTRIRNTKKP